jgi:DNA-binding MarR family transcriptional regulator
MIVSVELAFAKVCVIIQLLNFGDMETQNDNSRELTLLEQVEHDPDVNQSTLATQLGVAVGTVNWHLKRLVAKGYVKVQRAERKKLRYIITPEGIALRARLTVDYIERSFDLYRKTRHRIKEHLDVVRAAGFNRVRVLGEGDVADICKLSCLEQGFAVVQDADAPALELKGWKVILNMGDRT